MGFCAIVTAWFHQHGARNPPTNDRVRINTYSSCTLETRLERRSVPGTSSPGTFYCLIADPRPAALTMGTSGDRELEQGQGVQPRLIPRSLGIKPS